MRASGGPDGRAPPLSPSLSAFIDACRVLAAGVVLFGHLDALGFVPVELAGRPNRAGHDAVIVFFVLSGLVIAHAAAGSQRGARAYAVARAARVYSVAVPVVLVGLALDRIGLRLDPAGYPLWQYARWPLHLAYQWLFLGEAWTHTTLVPFSNVPYWSLAYEAWYYALFGVACFAPGAARWPLAALVLAAMGPKPWLLLPAWLGGVALHRLLARPAPPGASRARAQALVAAGIAGYALFLGTGAQAALERTGQRLLTALHATSGLEAALHPGYSRYFLADWVTAALFALVVLGLSRWQPRVPAPLARAAHVLAGMSFTLYLLHYPLLKLLRAAGLAALPGWSAALAAAALVLGATALLALLTEQQRRPWRRLFGAAWDALARLSRRSAR